MNSCTNSSRRGGGADRKRPLALILGSFAKRNVFSTSRKRIKSHQLTLVLFELFNLHYLITIQLFLSNLNHVIDVLGRDERTTPRSEGSNRPSPFAPEREAWRKTEGDSTSTIYVYEVELYCKLHVYAKERLDSQNKGVSTGDVVYA